MASSSSSAQQRSIASPKIYDVFISHRGPDVKETFAKKLYERLQQRGCRAFLDRKELEGGDSIPSAIHDAICSSRVQIAIFSKGYAQSSWCLDELVFMLQQRETLFIPVFYGVEPWELRHVDNDKSQYAMAFSNYERKGRNLEKLDEWKNGLVSASNISGYVLSQHENNLCDEIVSRVEKEMKKWIPLHVAKYPVGLAELVRDFERFCSNRATDKARIVGIFGLGGAGKTTLAKEFFNRRRSSYSASCFLSDVRESHTRHDLHFLQSKLLDNLFSDKQVLTNVNDGIAILRHRLGRAAHLHFLIVLDDIDHQEQLDALLPEGMLSAGSLVIITTRDQGMLRLTDASSRYRMKGMEEANAKELFCNHAFGGRTPPIAYDKLIDNFVKFCGGLPLSLKVLGAHLYGRNEDYWDLELEKVKYIPPKDIMQRLKISFDGLNSQEQQIFIDIACFFNKISISISHSRRKAISMWNVAGWSAENAVQTLQEKSLVEINISGCFQMHDHLRDLGRQIADESGPPRLWHPQNLRSLEAKGLKKILAQIKVRCFLDYFKDSQILAQRKARRFPYCFLDKFEDSQIEATISCFIGSVNDSVEPELLWLEIHRTEDYLKPVRLKSIPSWIPLRKLLCLSVFRTEDLWTSFQKQIRTNTQASFDLRFLHISDSPLLQKLPDLIRMLSHLEELFTYESLENTDPTSLVQSLQGLNNFQLLELWGEDGGLFSGHLDLSKGGAPSNCAASTSSRMDNLKTIILGDLRNISKLSISRDVCPRLRSLNVRGMDKLKEMDLNELVRLNTLKVSSCPLLKRISGLSSLTGLESLQVWNCSTLETVSGISSLTGLQSLYVGECDKLETVSGLSSLTRLQSLEVGGCPKLETLSELSPLTEIKVFEIEECGELKSLPSLAHQQHLKRINISRCQQLHTVHGFEELQGLKSLIIEVPESPHGYEWVRDCIYGVRRLPSEFTVVVGKPVDDASFRLNVNLFSELIGIQTVVEITGGKSMPYLRGSSNAITIYALLVESSSESFAKDLHLSTASGYYGGWHNFPCGCEWMIIVIQTPHVTQGMLSSEVTVNRGIMATVNEGEEEKALAPLQIIFDRLYR